MSKVVPPRQPHERERDDEGSKQPSDSYIGPEQLEEFTQLYKNEFGVQLSDEEALRRAINLVNFFEAVYRPMPASSTVNVPARKEVNVSMDRPPKTDQEGKQLKLF